MGRPKPTNRETRVLPGPSDLLALTSPIADNISANGVGLVLGMLFRFAFYRWWVFSPARSAAGRAAAKAGADEPAPITAPTLAGSPDGGLVGD